MSSTTVKRDMALPGTGPSFTRCGTCWLQLFYVYWSKMEMIIKYFASIGTVSHDFYTHIQKKIAVLPQNGMLLIMTYYNSDCRSSQIQVLCLEKKNEQLLKSYWRLHFLSLA